MRKSARYLVILAAFIASTSSSWSAEIRVLSLGAMRGVIGDVTAAFQTQTGHTLVVEFAEAGIVNTRIAAGETFDVVVNVRSFVDELAAQNRIVPGSVSDIAQSSISVVVRAGALHPDLQTSDAAVASLRASPSVAYSEAGMSGLFFVAALERLGIAPEITGKGQVLPNSPGVIERVAQGGADLGIVVTTATLGITGVDIVGKLPTEMVGEIVLSGGVTQGSAQADAANAFVDFLASSATAGAIPARGLEPL